MKNGHCAQVLFSEIKTPNVNYCCCCFKNSVGEIPISFLYALLNALFDPKPQLNAMAKKVRCLLCGSRTSALNS